MQLSNYKLRIYFDNKSMDIGINPLLNENAAPNPRLLVLRPLAPSSRSSLSLRFSSSTLPSTYNNFLNFHRFITSPF